MKYITDEKFRTQRGNIRYLEELRLLAKKNRHTPTLAEKVIWNRIKNFQPHFLRQKPVNRFIIDFYCPKLLLAVKADGSYHLRRKNYEQVLANISVLINELEIIINNRKFELKY